MAIRHLALATALLLGTAACGSGEASKDTSSEDDGGKKKKKKKSKDDDEDKKEEKKSGPPEKKDKFEVTWKRDTNFTASSGKGEGRVSIYDRELKVTLTKWPDGTFYKAGDKTGETKGYSTEVVLGDAMPLYAKWPVDKLMKYEVDPETTIELIRPDGSWAEVKLKPYKLNIFTFKRDLEKVENGAVKFPGEGEDDPIPGLSILYPDGSSKRVFGQAKVMSDIDAVALGRQLDEVKGTKKCTGYKNSKKEKMPDIELQLKEYEVTIYDRRKGGVVAKKVFPPENRCPSYVTTTKGENTATSSRPFRAIESWLRSQAK